MSIIISKLLRSIYGTTLITENYEFISEFTVLWGLFESKFRLNEESLNYKRIATVANSTELKSVRENLQSFSNLPDFIIIEIQTQDVILAFTEIDFKVKIFPTFRKSEYDWFKKQFEKSHQIKKNNPKIILLMCFVCYRLRNNLFHGNKKFEELQTQKELFSLINNFLVEILIEIKNIDLK